MKFAGVMIVATFSVTSHAGLGQTQSAGHIPPSMKTGASNLERTTHEKFQDVMAQLKGLNEEDMTVMATRAVQRQAAELRRILPQWCGQIPISILLFVDFTGANSEALQARKFFRLALLVRDMYLDYPINQDTLLTFDTPQELRLSDQVRYRLVALSLLEAYQRLENIQDPGNSDLLLSMADLGNWTLHYLQLANDTNNELSFQVALAMNRFANLAMLNTQHETHNDIRLQRLAQASMNVVARNLAPVFALLLTTIEMRGSKSKLF